MPLGARLDAWKGYVQIAQANPSLNISGGSGQRGTRSWMTRTAVQAATVASRLVDGGFLTGSAEIVGTSMLASVRRRRRSAMPGPG